MKTKKSIKLGKVQIAKLTNQQLRKVYGGDPHILGPKNQSKNASCHHAQ